jgi:hypothetical protein
MAKAEKKVFPFSVRKQISYHTFPEPADTEARREVAAAEATQPAVEKCAVWIVHGMGQQVPYATLDELNQGICIGATAEGITVSPPEFREVKVGSTILQRVEITLSKGTQRKEVHLYESYWAPKTEGVVSLKSVISFLWDGGSRGLVNWKTGFHRALFDFVVSFSLPWTVPIYLCFTLAVLGALMTIDAIIVATGASWVGLGRLSDKINPNSIPPLTTIAGIAAAAGITFGVVLFLAQMMRSPRISPRATDGTRKPSHRYAGTIRLLGWIALIVTALTIIMSAVIMGVILWAKRVPAWLLSPVQTEVQLLVNLCVFGALALLLAAVARKRWLSSTGESPRQGWGRLLFFALAFILHLAILVSVVWLAAPEGWRLVGPPETSQAALSFCQPAGGFTECVLRLGCWACASMFLGCVISSSLWVWPFLAILSSVVRTLLVQYVGDVTVYVASNKIDKYDEVRKAIKTLAKDSALAVYSMKATEEENGEIIEREDFEYSKIAVVGHSLGSVIAYDTLNRLIADDALASGTRHIVDRTCLFLTFGSPLDKTAFFFSVMGRDTRHVREQLASVVQPLIKDPLVRREIPWVNVHSSSDVISGPLDFYNFPPNLPGTLPHIEPVHNVCDPDAFVPLVAHVEYWQNSTVWTELLDKL